MFWIMGSISQLCNMLVLSSFLLCSCVPLGLLFLINWFTDIFTEDLGTEG